MIQQANFKESEAGNENKSGIRTATARASVIGKPLGRLGWMTLLVSMMFSPMASFEQDGRIGIHQRQSVAVHRQKTALMRANVCCDPSADDMGTTALRPGTISFPDSRSVERADREMIRNHAESGKNRILPSLAMPQIEDADMDMDLMFRMSNAGWMTNAAAADMEMDIRFRAEHIPSASGLDFRSSDKEMNDHFLQEQHSA